MQWGSIGEIRNAQGTTLHKNITVGYVTLGSSNSIHPGYE